MPEQAKSDGVFRFQVLVAGTYRAFEFDPDLKKFTGAEALLVDRYAGDTQQWIGRMTAGIPTGADVVLIAFISARREQIAESGTAALDWDEFAEAVSPYTLRLAGEPTATKPNRADRRLASHTGGAAKSAPRTSGTGSRPRAVTSAPKA